MQKRNSSRTFCFLAIFAFIAGVASGCAKGAEKADLCPNGPQVACPCADGQMGLQQCLDGVYSTCTCGSTGSGAGGNANPTGGITGTGGVTSTGAQSTAAKGGTTAGSAGMTGQAAGTSAGTAGTPTVPATGGTCPAGYTCSTNSLLNAFIQNIKFCSENATTTDPANAIPPACADAAECTSKGLSGTCQDFSTPSGGLSEFVGLKKACLAMCQQ